MFYRQYLPDTEKLLIMSFRLMCCSLLYGAEDPSVAGMVLDSAFSNLFNLMLELADVYKIRLPKFTVRGSLAIFFLCNLSCMFMCRIQLGQSFCFVSFLVS